MAEAKKIKRVVKHPKLYQIVDGKLQKVAPGTEVQVTERKLEKSGKKFADPSERQSVVKGKLVADAAGSEMAEKLAKAEERAAKAEQALAELAKSGTKK